MFLFKSIVNLFRRTRTQTDTSPSLSPVPKTHTVQEGSSITFEEFSTPATKMDKHSATVNYYLPYLQILEIFATCILAFSSLIVACRSNTLAEVSNKTADISNTIAEKQAEISENQLELEKLLSKPMLSIEPIYDETLSTIDQVVFSNSGGPISNFQITVIPAFRFYFMGLEASPDMDIRIEPQDLFSFVPIYNEAYPICYVTKVNSSHGFIGSLITSPYISQCHKMMEEATIREDSFQTVSLEYFIAISYQDQYSETYQDYYHCVTGHYYDNPSYEVKELALPRFTLISPQNALYSALQNMEQIYLDSSNSTYYKKIYAPIWTNDIHSEIDLLLEVFQNTSDYSWFMD